MYQKQVPQGAPKLNSLKSLQIHPPPPTPKTTGICHETIRNRYGDMAEKAKRPVSEGVTM